MVDQHKKLVSMAKQFSGLPMKDLIGAPLIAASQANNMMAMTQTKFLLDTCFEVHDVNDDEIYKPIMINMTLTRPVINSDGSKAPSIQTDFNLPLLTIIPLNSLAVDDVKVNFEMEVKSSYVAEKSTKVSKTVNNKKKISDTMSDNNVNTELSGAITSSDKSDKNNLSSSKRTNTAKYEISAHAGQLPLPVGVTTIIETFTQSIAPIQLKTKEKSLS